ncbi:MAG: GGDEF domain-containing protein [Clostridia bacterium]|nr:GGDEF domain-containing protein [Clostridia bacterium]
MEATSKKDVTSMVESMITDANERNGKLLFIKYSNTFTIKYEDILVASNNNETTVQVLFHELKPGQMQGAYAPLMDWIGALYKRYFSKIEYREFLESCDVYPLHIGIFQTYFECGTCRRVETIVRNEAEYEHTIFINDMIKVFNTVAEVVPLLFVFENLQYCESSLLEFLYKLTFEDTDKKFSVLADYNEKYEVAEHMQENWYKFSDNIETYNMMLYWEFDSMIISDNRNVPFRPDKAFFGVYLIMLNNMINTLCLEQALAYFAIIREKLESGDMFVTSKERYIFYNIYGNAFFLNGDYDEAIEMSKLMHDVYNANRELHEVNYEYNFNELACLAYIYKLDEETAMNYVLECKRIAYGSGDGFLMFQADLLRYKALMRGWNEQYLVSAFGVMYEIDPDFLSLARKYDYINNLAYVIAFGYGNDQTYYRDSLNYCESRDHVVTSTKLAKELRNDYLLLLMWEKHIRFTMRYGYFNVTDYYYKCQLKIFEQAGQMREVGVIYNGLGYNRIIMGHYNYASEYFNSAIDVWYSLGMAEEVGMTLYNMAINSILMEEYSVAIELINTTLRIMKYLDQINLEYCNVSKLYGMLVYCSYKLNIEYNAQFYLGRMEYVLFHLLHAEGKADYNSWDNELFLYFLNRALLYKKVNPEEAQKYFDRARYHMERADDLFFFVYMLFAIEQSAFFKEQGKTQEFKAVLRKCIDHFKNHNCNEKADRLFALLNGKNIATKKIDSGLTKITPFELIELARRVGSEKELETQNRNISFLSKWQKLMNNSEVDNVGTLFHKSVKLIKRYFCADNVYMMSLDEENISLDCAAGKVELDGEKVNNIVSFLDHPQASFVVTRTEKRFYDYATFIKNFGLNDVFSMVGVPVYQHDELTHILIAYVQSCDNFVHNYDMLDEDDLSILKFAFRQLIDATRRLKARLEIEEMNAQLEKMSVTDKLTGLLNRTGFARYLEAEFKKLAVKNKTNEIPTTVLYIDLDNFKYYNDTFGHDIGDVLLVSFASLFKDIIKEGGGYSIRYGGDEFLVILPNATEDLGVEVAMSIYKKLDDTNGFEDAIKAKMGHNFVVPKNRRVSCSIGIATSPLSTMDAVTEALKNADSALYVVKKSTKGTYRVYQGETRD